VVWHAVPYIGEKTARELRKGLSRNKRGKTLTPRRAANLNKEFLQVKLGKRQRKELAKYVGDNETRLLTRQERQEETSSQVDSTQKSERKGVGDFMVNRSQQKEAFEQHQDRSARARDVDNQRRATLTTDFETWSNAPDRFDYPGIDTPGRKPRVQEDDKPFVEPDDFRREAENEGVFGTMLGGGQQQDEDNYDTFTAAVFGNSLSENRFDIQDDTSGSGSPFGPGIAREISEMTQEETGVEPEDADPTSAVAEVTLRVPEDEPLFSATPEIADFDADSDATIWDFR